MIGNNSAMPETALRHDCARECAYRMYIKHEQENDAETKPMRIHSEFPFYICLTRGSSLSRISFLPRERQMRIP